MGSQNSGVYYFMAATSKVNLKDQKQKKRTRGRAPNAKVGDVDSIINMILHESDKFDVSVVNQYGKFLQMKLDMANGSGDFTKASLKDRDKAIDFCISRAEDFLSEYFEEEVVSGEATSTPSNSQEGAPDAEEDDMADIISLEMQN